MNKEILKPWNEKIEEISKTISDFYNNLEKLTSGWEYNDLIDNISEGMKAPDGKRLTKKMKKKIAINAIKEEAPEFINMCSKLDILIDGMDDILQEKLSRVEDLQSQLDELEEAYDEVERQKDNLNM